MTPTRTRERIIDASAELLRGQGYMATSVKQIADQARAPFGSLYHFFPGGKAQLGAETIRVAGARYEQLIPAVFDPAPDVVTAVREFFRLAGENLHANDYYDACPIATVALEVSSFSEPLREACAEVFESWIAAGASRFAAAGVDRAQARQLAIALLCALEGAFVLGRALRSTEPLLLAGELVAERVSKAVVSKAVVSKAVAGKAVASEAVAAGPAPSAARVRPRLRARWPAP
jgi:AcrR family transcriptional regulator